jgi:hypothetical protein
MEADGVNRAVLWKNGKRVWRTARAVDAVARAVAVRGSEVLVAGDEYPAKGGHDVAMLWKNGQPMALTDGSHDAKALALVLDGPDEYVAGWESNGKVSVAMVWKNGKALPPLTDGTCWAQADSLVVVGGEPVAAGYEFAGVEDRVDGRKAGRRSVAMVWRNGAPIPLGEPGRASQAFAIAQAGGELFAAGHETTTAGTPEKGTAVTVWRLGAAGPVRTRLCQSPMLAFGNAIQVVQVLPATPGKN